MIQMNWMFVEIRVNEKTGEKIQFPNMRFTFRIHRIRGFIWFYDCHAILTDDIYIYRSMVFPMACHQSEDL